MYLCATVSLDQAQYKVVWECTLRQYQLGHFCKGPDSIFAFSEPFFGKKHGLYTGHFSEIGHF